MYCDKNDDAMNALNLYISTCRLVVKAEANNLSTWSDLDSLLPNLRLSLTCTVCRSILIDPQSPINSACQHHVCKMCVGNKKSLKPPCSWCKDYEMYQENKQLSIVIDCYTKLCQYLRISPLYEKLQDRTDNGHALLNIINENNGENLVLPQTIPICQNKINKLLPVNSDDISQINSGDFNYDNSSFENLSADLDERTYPSVVDNCELDSKPIMTSDLDESSDKILVTDAAPILSPISEHVENISVHETAPMLSPVPENDEDPLINTTNSVKSEEYVTESQSVQNYDDNLSDSSSVSSPSSQQLSPALPSHEESSENAIDQELDEFSLGPSLTSVSVMGLQPSPDLIEAANVNVLESLDESSCYGDLSDINLSECPLTSIGDVDIKTEILPNITDTVISLQQNQSVSSSMNSIFANSGMHFKSKVPECNISTPQLLPSTSNNDKVTVTADEGNSCLGLPSNIDVQLPDIYHKDASHIFQNSNAHCVNSSGTGQLLTSCSPGLNDYITPPPHNLLRTQPELSPNVSNNVRATILSPPLTSPIVVSSNICQNMPTSTIRAQTSTPNLITGTIIPTQMIQPSISSQPTIHKPINTNQIIQKPLHNAISVSLPSGSVGNAGNLIMNPVPPHGPMTRMILSQPSQQIHQQLPITSNHQQTFHTNNISTQRFISSNQNIINNITSSANIAPQISTSMHSNYVNIIPANAIFHGTNNSNKLPNKETQIKGTPILNNGSSLYSVMFAEGDSTKITIKRTPPDTKPFITCPNVNKSPQSQHINQEPIRTINIPNNHLNSSLMNKPIKPKTKPKPKPKRKGCRCGNATPSPGKLTCCGQRCPCYVEAKACIDCRCKGCRNPHRPGGKKVRPVIPHQANIQIHQLQPMNAQIRPVGVVNKIEPGLPISIDHSPFPPGMNHMPATSSLNHTIHSSAQAIRAFQTIQTVKSVSAMAPLQNIVSNTQLINFKESLLDSGGNSGIISHPSIPASNIVSMKPIKVRLDSVPNHLPIKGEKFAISTESDADVDIDT